MAALLQKKTKPSHVRSTGRVKKFVYIYLSVAEARAIHSRLSFRITNMGRLTFALFAFVCLAVLYQSQAKSWARGKLDNGTLGQDVYGGEIFIAVLTINIILFQHRFRIFLQIWIEIGRMYIIRP